MGCVFKWARGPGGGGVAACAAACHGTFNAATRTDVRQPPENRHAAAHGQQFLFAIASRSSKNIV